MVLSRSKQTIQEFNSALGISGLRKDIAAYFIKLAKGLDYSPTSDWFYNLFLPFDRPSIPKDIFEIRDQLQAAWWVEEEDIQQEIAFVLLKYHDPEKDKTGTPLGLLHIVAQHLRDYLVHQEKVFLKQSDWEQSYIEQVDIYNNTVSEPEPNSDLPQKTFNLNAVMQKLSTEFPNMNRFERYVLYLKDYLGLSIGNISAIILSDSRQVDNFLHYSRLKLEDLYGSNTSRRNRTTVSISRRNWRRTDGQD